MVCLGNICRSPMAEGILRDLDFEKKLTIDSAGTSAFHIGEAPDLRATQCMKRNQHDISNLRARQFTVSDFDDFDRIFVMDKSNLRDVLSLARNEMDRGKVSLLLDQIPKSPVSEVPDPYFGGEQGFEYVYSLLHDACSSIIEKYGR
jgi:protein-tyrosine phosphatase